MTTTQSNTGGNSAPNGVGAMTSADIDRIVAERVASATESLNRQLEDAKSGLETTAAKSAYAASKMKDIPEIYTRQLPNTADTAKLDEAAKIIRAAYRADLERAGIKAPPLSSESAKTPGEMNPLQYAQAQPAKPLSAYQNIENAFKQAGRVSIDAPLLGLHVQGQ